MHATKAQQARSTLLDGVLLINISWIFGPACPVLSIPKHSRTGSETPRGHLCWRKVCCISCVTENLFSLGCLLQVFFLLWLWIAIRCFYLNKQVSSPSFSQDVLQWSTSDWDKMGDTYVFNKWHQDLFKQIDKSDIELWLWSRIWWK